MEGQQTEPQPLLSIIIVHYNAAPQLRECLDSLKHVLAQNRYEVILIDNASPDPFWKTVLVQRGTQPKVIELPENIGFGAANNLGVDQARGEYLFFLNPDTLIQGDPFPPLLSFIRTEPTTGTVGPQLVNTDGTLQPSRGTFPHIVLSIAQLFKLKRLLPRDELIIPLIPSSLARLFAQWRSPDQVQEVDYTTGAALLIKKSVFEQIGRFDTRFFLYFEEIDLCQRLGNDGYKNFFFPEVSIVHDVDAAQEPSSGFKELAYFRSLLSYYTKHNPKIQLRLIKMCIRIKMWVRFYLISLKLHLNQISKSDHSLTKKHIAQVRTLLARENLE